MTEDRVEYHLMHDQQTYEPLDGVHGDIKPHNILMFVQSKDQFNREFVYAKIADFGYSFIATVDHGDALIYPARSLPWQAPEYHHRGFMISQVRTQDAYSFGLLCFWLLFTERINKDGCGSLASLKGQTGFISFAEDDQRDENNMLESLKENDGLRNVAQELVQRNAELDQEQKLNLHLLFDLTLVSDPRKRPAEFEKLASLLQEDW